MAFPYKGDGLGDLGGSCGTSALALLLASAAQGTLAVVMTIVFAGVPLVNVVVSLVIDTPQAGGLRW